MKLADVALNIIPDSRGEDTLEAKFTDEKFRAVASVPSGKSRGAHEAAVLAPKEALLRFKDFKSQLLSREFSDQSEFDNYLISLDGTPEKKNLGSNLILSLSLAWARLKAKEEGRELFEYIRSLTQLPTTNYQLSRPIFNVINGGAHAKNDLSFQEFQVIPEASDFATAFSLGKELYQKLKEALEKKFGKANVTLGDEAGFSAPFKSNEEALMILDDLISKNNYPLRIGLDVAASQFYKDGTYLLEGRKCSSEELKNIYLELIRKFNILSIEDPFDEEAFDSFASLTADLYGLGLINTDKNISANQFNQHESALVITDDLTTTNPERLKTAIAKKSGNAILIKPNQIGTLTETLEVVKMAYEAGWQTIVSHRSGETKDNFIADLAVGVGAWGIKAGAPASPERLSKYERLLEIYTKLQ